MLGTLYTKSVRGANDMTVHQYMNKRAHDLQDESQAAKATP